MAHLTQNLIEEEINRYSLRPRKFEEFIGQETIKEKLLIHIKAAKTRGQALEHILLVGPPGLGKTTLAKLVSIEMQSGFKTAIGPSIDRLDLATLLTNLEDNDIFFIDEIHRVRPTIQESMYPAMEDYKLDLPVGQGASADVIQVPLSRFTLIGATTREGLLAAPFRDRFGIRIHLDYYGVEEIELAVEQNRKILEIEMDSSARHAIALRSRGTMRVAKNLLLNVRDYASVKYAGTITGEIAEEALQFFQIDEMGLDERDRIYLRTLIEKFNGRAGAKSIAVAISEDERTVEEVYEPYLIKLGFIARTPTGRVVTNLAYLHLGYELPEL